MTSLGRLVLGVIVASGCGSQDSVVIKPGSVTALTFSGYPYLLYAPMGWRPDARLPALLLIHGSGGNGSGMLNIWRAFADAHGIVLVAPTLPLGAELEAKVPQLFPALMDTVKRLANVDPKRMSVFGYSAGGYSAFDAATLASTTFASAGVFAAIITPDYYWIIAQAKRKTRIAIYIGDHDQFFTLAQARATRDTLLGAGFPVHYVELTNQDHNYAAASAFVDPDFWTFVSSQ